MQESAKFFVKDDGDTILQNKGQLNDRESRGLSRSAYLEMYTEMVEIQ